jgi:hypothetical protein
MLFEKENPQAKQYRKIPLCLPAEQNRFTFFSVKVNFRSDGGRCQARGTYRKIPSEL